MAITQARMIAVLSEAKELEEQMKKLRQELRLALSAEPQEMHAIVQLLLDRYQVPTLSHIYLEFDHFSRSAQRNSREAQRLRMKRIIAEDRLISELIERKRRPGRSNLTPGNPAPLQPETKADYLTSGEGFSVAEIEKLISAPPAPPAPANHAAATIMPDSIHKDAFDEKPFSEEDLL